MADLSALSADQLAEKVVNDSADLGPSGSAALAEFVTRLKAAEDALKAERHRAVEAETRLIAAIRPNPKP